MKIAAATMVFNERIFLPIWLDHYGAQLGYENLFIIDDGSTDGSTSDKRIVNLVKKNRNLLDENDRVNLVSSFHEKLLDYYDIVIYTDSDEIIVVDPIVQMSLRDYLVMSDVTYKTVTGLNVLQEIGRENAIDLDRPLLEQRKFAEFDVAYCKPLISKVPMSWRPGFHPVARDLRYDHNLVLFHLRAIDIGVAKERLKTLNSIMFSADSLSHGHSTHFRMSEADYVQYLFARSAHDFEHAHQDLNFIQPLLTGPLYNTRPIVLIPERFARTINASKMLTTTSQSENHMNSETVSRLFSESMGEMITKTIRGRNEPCPCDSGKKYKHCHGTLS